PHFNACGGKAQCSTCRVMLAEGAKNVTPAGDKERALRTRITCSPNIRLACQTYVTGSTVQVHRIIRDPTDVFLYIGEPADADDRQELGEERELALFFLDIRDFTPFMEASLPFDVMHVIRRMFRIFKRVIEEFDGTIIETAGDGLYAVFGLKTNLTDAARSAVKAGQGLLLEVDSFSRTYLQPYFNVSFQLGIGLHCGKVIIGHRVTGLNNNMTVMGLPVNIASRLQNASKNLNNSFIVSDAVFRLLDAPTVTPTRNISLKGVHDGYLVHLMGNSYEGIVDN
ncbi:MAG: adenylate/guanylate cyclase domain-containing protein, partial [Chitinophagaceae bacterium]